MNMITVQTTVNVPLEKAWELWTEADHVRNWNNASEDWHTPKAENNLEEGGSFSYRMEAKDGSFGFDFGGKYTAVAHGEHISYVMDDGRAVEVNFESAGGRTLITESFDPETENPHDVQETGWQSILDNFKKYAESNNN
jgi:uncharacterized protein YndB with AHSA1/START domain